MGNTLQVGKHCPSGGISAPETDSSAPFLSVKGTLPSGVPRAVVRAGAAGGRGGQGAPGAGDSGAGGYGCTDRPSWGLEGAGLRSELHCGNAEDACPGWARSSTHRTPGVSTGSHSFR